MRHERKKAIPALPQTLNALADCIETNPSEYMCCGQPFYQYRTIDTQGKCSIIFGCTVLVTEIINLGGNELHADATFKVVPSKSKSRQLFIMHLIVQNHVSLFKIIFITHIFLIDIIEYFLIKIKILNCFQSIPIMYSLMESKTEEAYTILLAKCKLLFSQLTPTIIMTDYEMTLQNVFQHTYPQGNSYSCWFHYVQVGNIIIN